MKKDKVNKKVPKFEFGTYIDNPATDLYQNQINWAKAAEKAGNNDWVKGLKVFGNLAQQVGTSMMNKGVANGEGADGKGVAGFLNKNNGNVQSGMGLMSMFGNMGGFAMGGKVPGVPVEVEGQEVGETPNGEMMEFDGPSHEAGGIPISLPQGTEIYSKRIKVDGVSMADRKKKRERKTVTLESLFEKNKTDALIKNSLKRTQENNQIEEDSDNKIQMVVKQLLDKQENPNVEKHKYGNPVGEEDPFGILHMIMNGGNMMDNNQYGGFGTPKKGSTVNNSFGPQPYKFPKPPQADDWKGIPYDNNVVELPDTSSLKNNKGTGIDPVQQGLDITEGTNPAVQPLDSKTTTPGESSTGKFDNLLGGMTFGDMLGMAGNFYQADKIMKTIKSNRAGDTPNINAFKDYGKDGLNTLDKTKQYVNQIRDQKLKDLELSRTGSIKRNSNSARGINTVRALNLATDASVNKTKEETYNSFAEQMMGILGQQAGMENQRDEVVMRGEDTRDDRDRQDRDNYFSQLITGYKNNGQVMSETGRNLNQIKTNDVMQNLINQLSAYGITVDSNGKLSSKGAKKTK